MFPAIMQILLLPLCPESPRYLLLSKHQEHAAREALMKLRCTSMIEDDIEEMRAEELQEHRESHVSTRDLSSIRATIPDPEESKSLFGVRATSIQGSCWTRNVLNIQPSRSDTAGQSVSVNKCDEGVPIYYRRVEVAVLADRYFSSCTCAVKDRMQQE